MVTIKLLNKTLATLLCGTVIFGGFYSIGDSIFKSLQKKKLISPNNTIQDSRLKMQGIKSYITVDTVEYKDNKSYSIRLNGFNTDGSVFTYSMNTDKKFSSFDNITEENILSSYESYEVAIKSIKANSVPQTTTKSTTKTTKKNQKVTPTPKPSVVEEINPAQYVSYVAKDGQGNYSKSIPLNKTPLNIKDIQLSTDKGNAIGIFDFAYNLQDLSLKQITDSTGILIFKGQDTDQFKTNIKISIDSHTLLPISEEYDSEKMYMLRSFICYDKAFPKGDVFWKLPSKDKIKLLVNYINELQKK